MGLSLDLRLYLSLDLSLQLLLRLAIRLRIHRLLLGLRDLMGPELCVHGRLRCGFRGDMRGRLRAWLNRLRTMLHARMRRLVRAWNTRIALWLDGSSVWRRARVTL